MTKLHSLILGGMGLLLVGCSGPTKMVIPSYAAPAEYKKIQGISSGGDVREGSYLAMAINPEVTASGSDKKQLSKVLVSNVKQTLTETNFITIYPIYDLSNVALNMEVMSFVFNKVGGDIKAELDVTFTITKGATEFFVKKYSDKTRRHSSDPMNLPSKDKVIAELGKKVVGKFISDISPRKTYQTREFKSMPGELEYVMTYAKQKNYQGAIDGMESVPKDQQDMNFLYNLAILYEAQASEREDLKLLDKAKFYYEAAFRKGGSQDEVVIAAKGRFDNFYRLLSMTAAQTEKNAQLKKELDETYGPAE